MVQTSPHRAPRVVHLGSCDGTKLMGRAKSPGERRDIGTTVRLSGDELARLDALRGERSRPAYVAWLIEQEHERREAALNTPESS